MSFDGHKAYEDYLQSEHWKAFRVAWLANYGIWIDGRVQCPRCKTMVAQRDAHLHHKTYERLGKEENEDVELLCQECHEKEHGVVRNHPGLIAKKRVQELERKRRPGEDEFTDLESY